jgi:tRNA(fMet)-specific endonuclease VapC
MTWMLDTNAWIHYLKHLQSPVRDQLLLRKPADIVVCSIVRAELLYGAEKYGVPERRRQRVSDTLAPFLSLPFDDHAADHYGGIRHLLETNGTTIGPQDLLIAAIRIAHGCTLVASNLREFSRVPNLSVEDWVAAP